MITIIRVPGMLYIGMNKQLQKWMFTHLWKYLFSKNLLFINSYFSVSFIILICHKRRSIEVSSIHHTGGSSPLGPLCGCLHGGPPLSSPLFSGTWACCSWNFCSFSSLLSNRSESLFFCANCLNDVIVSSYSSSFNLATVWFLPSISNLSLSFGENFDHSSPISDNVFARSSGVICSNFRFDSRYFYSL
jgi:hypothetical protein